MSKADEMFKKLGYDEKIETEKKIKYQDSGNEDLNIIFLKDYKVITGCPTYDYFLNMEILQTINEKVKELGWLDER
jgi:hypothetical protein